MDTANYYGKFLEKQREENSNMKKIVKFFLQAMEFYAGFYNGKRYI